MKTTTTFTSLWRSYTKKSIMKAFSYIQRMSIGSGLTIGDGFWLTMNGDLSGCANTWTENCLALQLYIWGLVRLCKFHERRNVRMDIMTINTEDGFCATYIYFMKGLKSTISFLDGGAFDRIPLLVKWSTKTHTFGVCFWTKWRGTIQSLIWMCVIKNVYFKIWKNNTICQP